MHTNLLSRAPTIYCVTPREGTYLLISNFAFSRSTGKCDIHCVCTCICVYIYYLYGVVSCTHIRIIIIIFFSQLTTWLKLFFLSPVAFSRTIPAPRSRVTPPLPPTLNGACATRVGGCTRIISRSVHVQ